jgi:hypothetical protein
MFHPVQFALLCCFDLKSIDLMKQGKYVWNVNWLVVLGENLKIHQFTIIDDFWTFSVISSKTENLQIGNNFQVRNQVWAETRYFGVFDLAKSNATDLA